MSVVCTTSVSSYPTRTKTQCELLNHRWPIGVSAAIAKLFDEAGIPNVIWGDLLNAIHGCPFVPAICGFVVPDAQLQLAITKLTTGGLPPCQCKSQDHFAREGSGKNIPVHFAVPMDYGIRLLFLVPNESVFLNLIPLTPQHPNPASLKWDRVPMPLDPPVVGPITLGSDTETHPINVLTEWSLMKTLILLYVLSPPPRVGIVCHYIFYARQIDYTDKYFEDAEFPTIQRLYVAMFKHPIAPKEERLCLERMVRKEWESWHQSCSVGGT